MLNAEVHMFTPPLPKAARDVFFSQVWLIARQVPPGQVTTYGQIAAFIPSPPGIDEERHLAYRARWAGAAMAAAPEDVPWQRVVNGQGKISERPDADQQRQLLEAEGVTFSPAGKIDLKRFGWPGPAADWLRAHGLLAAPEGPSAPHQPGLF
jgi:methylated-DNA-protein-cysteine methyltransferase-like protein